MIADAVLEVLFLSRCETGLLGLVCNFKPVRNDFFLNDHLNRQVEVAGIVDFNAFFDDAGVNGVFTCFNLTAQGDLEFHVDVLVRRKAHGHEV